MTRQTVLYNFGKFSSWIRSLESIEEKTWYMPIAENKWSISEIIAHLFNWDRYLIHEILPAVQVGHEMIFPDFDTYNKQASDYIQSGVSKSQLIEETTAARDLLIKVLTKMPVERLNLPLSANGISHCPHTGTAYSLIYIIEEFTAHDNHHKKQIMHFLNTR
jgi:hypothetical protein